jgi:hypothetical protein
VEASRRQLSLLGGILVVIAAVLYWQSTRGNVLAPEAVAAARGPGQAASQARPAQRAQAAPQVPLLAMAALERPQPEPADSGRDPFRFGDGGTGRSAAGPGLRGSGGRPAPAAQSSAAPVMPAVPAGPPPPPPIQLKFIGTARQGSGRLYAVLRDDRGIYYGADGDVVEGRYRVLRVSPEAVEVSYVDGRGRVNIPLSGGQP